MDINKTGSDKSKTHRVLRKAARYKFDLEIHGEHLEAHRNRLREIQERHSLIIDESIPRLSLMGEALQSMMDSMRLKVDRLRDIRLEIERDQATEANAEPVVDETPPQRIVINPQVLHDMGLRDLSNLVSHEVVKLVCVIAIRGAPITTPSATPLSTSPSTPSTIIQTSPQLPLVTTSPQKTYQERQKERRKQKKVEKAKLEKE
ncbi:hypothetical protein F4814DRAFT_457572 [Daldinia grandis]|nr:hypothetical protein F4814DRAFT_457572 [Daldinia grandis]